MFHRVLTAFERKRIRVYLDNGRGNGDRDVNIRNLVYLIKRHLGTINEDCELLTKLLAKYERETKRAKS
jgi:hypothetical protein